MTSGNGCTGSESPSTRSRKSQWITSVWSLKVSRASEERPQRGLIVRCLHSEYWYYNMYVRWVWHFEDGSVEYLELMGSVQYTLETFLMGDLVQGNLRNQATCRWGWTLYYMMPEDWMEQSLFCSKQSVLFRPFCGMNAGEICMVLGNFENCCIAWKYRCEGKYHNCVWSLIGLCVNCKQNWQSKTENCIHDHLVLNVYAVLMNYNILVYYFSFNFAYNILYNCFYEFDLYFCYC